MKAPLEQGYDLHGLSMRLCCDSAALHESAAGLLRSFAAAPTGNGDSWAWTACVGSAADPSEMPRLRSADAELAFEQSRFGLNGQSWGYSVWRDRGRTIVEVSDRGLVVVESGTQVVNAWAVNPESWTAKEREGFVFLIASEILRTSRRYPLHAAAVERDGRAVLILGPSGAGKSTCLISLMRAGWRCLSDDHPLVCETDEGPRVLPWHTRVEMTAETPARFADLGDLRLRTGELKLWLYPQEFGGGAAHAPTPPTVLLFPKVVDWPRSSLERVSARFALEELMAQGMVVVDRASAAHQFALLARLARETIRARVFFGSDVKRLPILVDGLIEAAEA